MKVAERSEEAKWNERSEWSEAYERSEWSERSERNERSEWNEMVEIEVHNLNSTAECWGCRGAPLKEVACRVGPAHPYATDTREDLVLFSRGSVALSPGTARGFNI